MKESSIVIPDPLIEKWQELADLLAEIVDVPAALIMKMENAKPEKRCKPRMKRTIHATPRSATVIETGTKSLAARPYANAAVLATMEA